MWLCYDNACLWMKVCMGLKIKENEWKDMEWIQYREWWMKTQSIKQMIYNHSKPEKLSSIYINEIPLFNTHLAQFHAFTLCAYVLYLNSLALEVLLWLWLQRKERPLTMCDCCFFFYVERAKREKEKINVICIICHFMDHDLIQRKSGGILPHILFSAWKLL